MVHVNSEDAPACLRGHVGAFTLDELELAPDAVRAVLADLPPQQVEIVSTSPGSDRLRNAYLDAGVVGPVSSNGAAHIAVDKIVHFEKIGGYEGVNSLRGYPSSKTKSFAVVPFDGPSVTLDSAGNAKASELVRNSRKRRLLSVAITGEMVGKAIRVDSISAAPRH